MNPRPLALARIQLRSLPLAAATMNAIFLFASAARAQQWIQTSAVTNAWVSIACSADGNTIISPVDGGGVYISTNTGTTWSLTSLPTEYYQAATVSGDGTVLLAAVSGGPMFVSTNAGVDWFQSGAPTEGWWAAAASTNGMRLFAASEFILWASTNYGVDWYAASPNAGPWLSIACSIDGSRVLAADVGGQVNGVNVGRLYTSSDAGLTWAEASAPANQWDSVAFSADGSRAIASAQLGGPVSLSSDSGMNWIPTALPDANWTSVASSADGTRLIATTAGGQVYITTDSGATWTSTTLPAGVIPYVHTATVAVSADGTKFWAAVYGGGIYTLRASAPSATTLSAIGTNDAVVLAATANPNGMAMSAWFEWGLNTNYGNATTPIALNAAWTNASVSFVLANLTAGTVYHYRVVATNSLGCSAGQDEIVQIPGMTLIGPNPMTNECHAEFNDPGAIAFGLPPQPPLAVSAGAYHGLALLADRTMIGWGSSEFGEGNPPAEATNVVAISAGGYESIALRADGSIVAWGLHMGGIIPPETETDFIAVAAGYDYSMALKSDGTVVSWGAYPIGYEPPATVPESVSNIVTIAAGYGTSLGLKAAGTVIGWGDNSYGETNVPPEVTNVVAISAGAAHSLALRQDGTVVGWGSDEFGQIDVPPEATNIVSIAAGGLHSMALRSDGTVLVWGLGSSGQTNIPPAATNVVEISAGYYDCYAKTAGGLVIAWGGNYYGQATIPAELNTNYLPVSVSGTVDSDGPGTYTLTYSATNSLGIPNALTRTVYVVDTAPPQFFGVTNIVVEATSLSGAVVNFNVGATDLCSGVSAVISTPSSGGTFPIGTNTVWCTATDASANTGRTNFLVTVLGARGAITDVLSEMTFFTAGVPQERDLPIRTAINNLAAGLATNLWLSETQINRNGGAKVFEAEQIAVTSLSEAGRTDVSEMVDGWMDRLVKSGRLLALVQLNAATNTAFERNELVPALTAFKEGDAFAQMRRYPMALKKYEIAWKLAEQFPGP